MSRRATDRSLPLEIFPTTMRSEARVAPHAWANEAMGEILRLDGTVLDVLSQIGLSRRPWPWRCWHGIWMLQRTLTCRAGGFETRLPEPGRSPIRLPSARRPPYPTSFEVSAVTDLFLTVHPWLGYAVSALVLVASLVAFKRAKDGVEFRAGIYRAAYVLLAVQILLGILLYGLGGYWDAGPLIAYVHPLIGVMALGLGQMLLARARKTRMAADAHRLAGRGLLLTLLLVVVAIGVSSAAATVS